MIWFVTQPFETECTLAEKGKGRKELSCSCWKWSSCKVRFSDALALTGGSNTWICF